MGRVGVLGVSFASLPDFVEQECAGRVRGAVQIVAKAAFFFSSGSYQGAQLRFENRFLAFARAAKQLELLHVWEASRWRANLICATFFSCPNALR